MRSDRLVAWPRSATWCGNVVVVVVGGGGGCGGGTPTGSGWTCLHRRPHRGWKLLERTPRVHTVFIVFSKFRRSALGGAHTTPTSSHSTAQMSSHCSSAPFAIRVRNRLALHAGIVFFQRRVSSPQYLLQCWPPASVCRGPPDGRDNEPPPLLLLWWLLWLVATVGMLLFLSSEASAPQ